MPIEVVWSDRLERLADALLDRWASDVSGDPFARCCIVVGDLATRDWLRRRFLLDRPAGRRRILANVEFRPLAEFVNDWLAAACGRNGAVRDPAAHPYSRQVMTWRIASVLGRADPGRRSDAVFAPLVSYIGADASARRRLDLSARIARLFDDYLAYRHPMLARWENPLGGLRGDEEPWQRELYLRLARSNPATYSRDYSRAISGDADAAVAFANGFPRYRAVHVFDVAFAPWPYFAFLRRIAELTPVTVWSFSPCAGFWMDVEGRRESARARAAAIRSALENGTEPPEFGMPGSGEESDRALLSALATGARGALLSQIDASEGACLWLPADGGAPVDAEAADDEPFSALRGVSAALHVCHSPRRELETVRNGIYTYLATHPGARPGDVLVLCADWKSYAPLAEAVFAAEPDEPLRMPLRLEGAVAEETPLARSFADLLAFRDNRFEASAVVGLLGVPEIRSRFGIAADEIDTVRDMVREANIRWGFDDADVRRALGLAPEEGGPFAHTWRRGLDRLELDALTGPRPDPDALVQAGALGMMLPCGNVESGRERLVSRLDSFVSRLAALRTELSASRPAAGWRTALTAAVDGFYAETDGSMDELASFRRAIDSAARSAEDAWLADGGSGDTPAIEPEVFIAAALEAVRSSPPGRPESGDAVRFAPLKNASATTADLVWICGLNDGSFPRDGARPSFDQIGRHQTPYDASLREWDAYALLKAALGARKELALSHVGRSARTNEAIPPAVPLADLADWFDRNRPGALARFVHPLQSYSARYFYECGGDPLPPNHSAADREAARLLTEGSGADDEGEGAGLRAFALASDGATVVDLDDLADFISRPGTFLLRKLKVRTGDPSRQELADDETTGPVHLRTPEISRLKLLGESARTAAAAFVERGRAESEESVRDAEDAVLDGDARDKILRRPMKLATPPPGYRSDSAMAIDILRRAGETTPERVTVRRAVAGGRVTVVGTLRLVEDGGTFHSMAYSEYQGELGAGEAGLLLRHVLGHAAGRRFLSVLMYGDGKLRALLPMDASAAAAKLDDILAVAFGPLPEGVPDLNAAWKDDALPEEERRRILDGVEFIASARLPQRKSRR